jgi:hypothetical protein
MRKVFWISPIILATVTLYWMGGAVARGNDLETEYVQVRRIALKDPRVQAAFAKANERLNQRILEIDPSLKPIVDRAAAVPAAIPAPVGRRVAPVQRFAPAPVAAAGREHIVLSGETLDSIAHRYRVRVATLERVNHIADARKLRVGQRLVIPLSETAPAAPAAPVPQPSAPPAAQPAPSAASEATPKQDGDFWDKLKSGL